MSMTWLEWHLVGLCVVLAMIVVRDWYRRTCDEFAARKEAHDKAVIASGGTWGQAMGHRIAIPPAPPRPRHIGGYQPIGDTAGKVKPPPKKL